MRTLDLVGRAHPTSDAGRGSRALGPLPYPSPHRRLRAHGSDEMRPWLANKG
jgi:hypothetical protein